MLVVIVLVPGAESSRAAFPGVNGRVAFTRCEDGAVCKSWGIWTANSDGGAAARLFADPSFFADDPAFSADGRRIVMQRCAPDGKGGFNCGIAVVDAHGQNLKQLTPTSAGVNEDYPSFSPDGNVIIFARNSDLWTMGADGSSPHALTSGPDYDTVAEFSPSGREIVFQRNGQIWLMDANGSNKHQIPGSGTQDRSPSFSPDGSKVAYADCSATCQIYVIGVDGSGKHSVATPGSGGDTEPAFSPDGRAVVFERRPKGFGAGALYIANASGAGTPHQFTNGVDYKSSWGRVPTPSVDSAPTITGTLRVGHELTAQRLSLPPGWHF